MNSDYFLMYKDEVVIRFDKGFKKVELQRQGLLPYGLRGDCSAISLYQWITKRATPLERKNVDFLYMLLHLPRSAGGKTELVQQYGGVSVNDCFWIKQQDDLSRWEDVSPFTGVTPWSENDRAFGYRMLSGTGDSIRSNRFSPETTIQGNWSKCLMRRSEGIYLYKANDEDPREIEASEFAKSLGLDVVEYWQEDYEDVSCSVCRIGSDENSQWIFADEIGVETAAAEFPHAYATMKTFDYIVGNADRHALNWGWVTNENLEPMKLTPMFDFNFALENFKMELPQHIDTELLDNAKKLLDETPDLPNRAFYLARICELQK